MPSECGTLRNGGMAEWSIATVLKTVGLTAPGVRIPLPPLQVMKPFSWRDHLFSMPLLYGIRETGLWDLKFDSGVGLIVQKWIAGE